VDRTVLPGNPAGEAADGAVGVEGRASMADSRAGRANKDNGRGGSRPRVADRIAITGGVLTGRNSVGSAPDR
jgi:hypothetical protein